MPYPHVQGTDLSGQTGTAPTVTFGAAVTPGNTITGVVGWVGSAGGTDTLSSVTDNLGNTYTVETTRFGAYTAGNYYWAVFNLVHVINAPTTITATLSASGSFILVMVDEWNSIPAGFTTTTAFSQLLSGSGGPLSATLTTKTGAFCAAYIVNVASQGITSGQTEVQNVSATWASEWTIASTASQAMTATLGAAAGSVGAIYAYSFTNLNASIPQSTTLYVSPTGNDSNNGTSPSTPWQTIAHVNSQQYSAGVSILFEGGQSFSGGLFLNNFNANTDNPPTQTSPITISSYGSGNATISATAQDAISILDLGNVNVSALTLVGDGSADHNGVIVRTTGTVGAISSLNLTNLSATTFGRSGVILVTQDSANALSNVTINAVTVNDCTTLQTISNNITAGIITGIWTSIGIVGVPGGTFVSTLALNNITVSNCEVKNCPGDPTPPSGSQSSTGILFCNATNSLVQRNYVHDNGASEVQGNSGIEFNWVTASTIRFNEVFNQISANAGADGNGIDLDVGCQNCLVEYNYLHHNGGPGIAIINFGTFTNTANTIRFNILENNEQSHASGELSYFSFGGGTAPSSIDTYNNTIFNNITGSLTSIAINTGHFCNNIIMGTFGDISMIFNPVTSLIVNGNLYYANPAVYNWNWNAVLYHSLLDFQTGSGQEPNGIYLEDPLLVNPGNGGTVGGYDPPAPTAYALQATSPASGTALNLDALYSIDPGSQDYYGNAVPDQTGDGYSIGAYNTPTQESPPAMAKPDYVSGWTKGTTPSLTNTPVNIKTAYGQLASLTAYNPNASAAYIQVFDALAANVTVGTTTPVFVFPLAQTSSLTMNMSTNGLQFSNAISMAATTTATGGTAPGSALTVSYAYL